MTQLFLFPPVLEVLATAPWIVHFGGIICPGGGLEGQLTKCVVGGIVCYVRETIKLAEGHFGISSGERLGLVGFSVRRIVVGRRGARVVRRRPRVGRIRQGLGTVGRLPGLRVGEDHATSRDHGARCSGDHGADGQPR